MSGRVYTSALALAASVFNRPDHLPRRTCLGCGGGTYRLADGRKVWADCSSRGVEVYGLVREDPSAPFEAHSPVRAVGRIRFTWSQIARAIPPVGQEGMGL